ncbi:MULTISPECIES: DUF3099 domain-containing protein [unclassified Nocardioides]|uniref:DUF3099 domain-containing protein n=1 Tax=unclassified Nocardioides TaxID=2615069 RepID=UPI0009F0FAA0|nr:MULTISPECIES: DUF3099 domain-containing protein [unclassified Nocardioides]GAW48217.1 Putative uncharacterized protein [Nocardioides sp. PD653-B2]GAW57423.1 putative uncharacterized protein [Nocardioides sp. PD653]
MARDLRREQDAAVRITTAASSRDVDIATRQRRYLLSMTLRSLCFVGAIVAALAHVGWLWPILIAGALILPYVAVVMANATSAKSDGFSLVDGQYGRPELTTGPKSGPDPGPDRP